MSWYLGVFKKYATFSGRARRKEFWMFILFNWIFSVVLIGLDNLVGTTFENQSTGIFSALYSLAVMIPGLAVAVRRLHDTGKSGWYVLVVLIPLAGFIWYIVLQATEGQPGENQYGPDPKAVVG